MELSSFTNSYIRAVFNATCSFCLELVMANMDNVDFCVYCEEPVLDSEQGLICDTCGKWQHRRLGCHSGKSFHFIFNLLSFYIILRPMARLLEIGNAINFIQNNHIACRCLHIFVKDINK